MTESNDDDECISLKLEFRDCSGGRVCYFALTQELFRELLVHRAQLQDTFTALAIHDWLQDHGAWLHRTDGPASVISNDDGSHWEAWHRDGDLHRMDGPALIDTSVDGVLREGWYMNNQIQRADGPAFVKTYPNGERYQAWYSHGELVREERIGSTNAPHPGP